jgi:HAD superfamily hydrolase (TIGR01509 family)
MDGVLVDTEHEYQRLDIQLARELGFELSAEELNCYVGVRTLEVWQDLKRKYRFAQSAREMAQKETELMARHYAEGGLRPFAGSVALLKSCAKSGLMVAVATSSAHENAESVIRRLSLEGDVKAMVSGCMVKRSKPAPDIFLLAMERLGVSGAECVVIEDADSGVKAARAAGVKRIVGLRHAGGRQRLDGADMVVESLGGVTVETLRGLME